MWNISVASVNYQDKIAKQNPLGNYILFRQKLIKQVRLPWWSALKNLSAKRET